MIDEQFSESGKGLQSDNGGGYVKSEMKSFVQSRIKVERLKFPGTLYPNGVA